ncbi:hypothetical protein ABPG75_013989 [Micractinium tetrahymenae]
MSDPAAAHAFLPPAAAVALPPPADRQRRFGDAGYAAPPPPPEPPSYTLLDVRSAPIPLKLTWAKDGVYPAAICVRKDLKVLSLLKFTAKADLTLPDLGVVYGFSCKDTLFHGRFSLNVPARMVEYRKKFALPNGSTVAVSAGLQHVGARWDTRPLQDQFRPMLSMQLHFADLSGHGSGNVVYTGDGFNLKQRVPIPSRWTGLKWPKVELEAYANLRIPQLTARYSVQRDGLRRGVPSTIGDGDAQEPLHLHISAANVVLRL